MLDILSQNTPGNPYNMTDVLQSAAVSRSHGVQRSCHLHEILMSKPHRQWLVTDCRRSDAHDLYSDVQSLHAA